MTHGLPDPTFHDIGRFTYPPSIGSGRVKRTPVYAVRIGGVSVGVIHATTPSPYPGRSKATYIAYPAKADPWRDVLTKERHLGPYPSRLDATRGIVKHLAQYKFGRALLDKARA